MISQYTGPILNCVLGKYEDFVTGTYRWPQEPGPVVTVFVIKIQMDRAMLRYDPMANPTAKVMVGLRSLPSPYHSSGGQDIDNCDFVTVPNRHKDRRVERFELKEVTNLGDARKELTALAMQEVNISPKNRAALQIR
jgi:hypothetical protein